MIDPARAWIRRSVVIACYVALSVLIFWMWLIDTESDTALNGYYAAKVPDMIYGRASKPCVMRTLLPSAVRVTRALISDSAARAMEGAVFTPRVMRTVSRLGWEREYLVEYLLAAVLMYLSLLGFMFALRRLFRALYVASDLLCDSAPVFALLCLPVFFKQGTHFLYDFPTLFFFTLLLLLLYQKRWYWFYPVLLISCVNKETTVLIILVFMLHYFRSMARGVFVAHLGAQMAVCALVKGSLTLIFKTNPGGAWEWRFNQNINFMLLPYSLTYMICAALILAVIFHKWREKPLYLRKASAIMAPLMMLYVMMGVWGEIRVFYEAFPILFLLSFHTVADVLFPAHHRPSTRLPGASDKAHD